jgi:hypothetical protein
MKQGQSRKPPNCSTVPSHKQRTSGNKALCAHVISLRHFFLIIQSAGKRRSASHSLSFPDQLAPNLVFPTAL